MPSEAMESIRTQKSNPETDRERSRSPLGTRSTTAPTATRGRRSRRRPFDWDKWRAEAPARETAEEAEEERRRNLTPEQRLKEDGARWLRYEFNTEPQAVILLQQTPDTGNRAGCRADTRCLRYDSTYRYSLLIYDSHRILVDTGRSYDRKRYYHVRCFLCMVDVISLIPTKFKLASAPSAWGLMETEWFKHKGCIDLDKIEEFFRLEREYEREHRRTATVWHEWSRKHEETCKGEANIDCTCPPEPKGPKYPQLEDYVTADDQRCELIEVLSRSQAEGYRESDTDTASE